MLGLITSEGRALVTIEEGVLADLSKLQPGYERRLSVDNFYAAGGQLRQLNFDY